MCVAPFAVAFGTNVPPLLLVYELRLHLSAAALTAMFGAYAVGLVPALLVSGPVPGVVAANWYWSWPSSPLALWKDS